MYARNNNYYEKKFFYECFFDSAFSRISIFKRKKKKGQLVILTEISIYRDIYIEMSVLADDKSSYCKLQ